MTKEIYLKIETYDGIITIPFLGMEEVDNFTVMYDDIKQLASGLIRLLKLPIDLYEIEDIYLTYDKYKKYRDDSCFYIKYRGDNFNYQSLQEVFATYLKNDKRRIYTTDIRYVKTEAILKYFGRGMIDEYDIEIAVRKFFEKGTGYKRKRDTYFLIKNSLTDVDNNLINRDGNLKIKIDSVDMVSKIDRSDLFIYSMGGDDYLSYLIEHSKKGEVEFDRAMDEIGQSDLEDIKRYLESHRYGIVDGVSDISKPTDREISCLEENTGLSIEVLRDNYVKIGKKRRSR